MSKINLIVSGELVELFDYESITLKRIIKDVKNPKKLFTDYSRRFTVPASKNNNRIFKHYYRADITNGIDARSMIDAEIRVNHINYKKGNVEVLGVEMRDGKPYSYNIIFYGKLTELSKRIGSDKLSVLSLNRFDHSSTYANVESRLNDYDGNVHGNDLIYPLVSRFDRFVLDSSSNYATTLDNTKNIQFIDNTRVGDDYGIQRKDLFPALKVSTIIEEIESEYDITFKGAVKQDSINELYLALHKASSTQGDNITKVVDGFVTDDPAEGVNVDSSGKYINLTNYAPHGAAYQSDHQKKIYVIPNTTSASWNLKLVSSLYGVVASSNQDFPPLSYTFDDVEDTFHFVLEADAADNFTLPISITSLPSNTQVHTWNISDSMVEEFIVSQNIPNVKVVDFLGDLFRRFNIVAEVVGSEITTYFYNYWMSLGEVKDISEFIDRDNHTINKPNIYSGVKFGFKDTDSVLSRGFERVNGRKYGELDYQLSDTQGNKLLGEIYNIDLKSTLLPLENVQGTTDGVTYSFLGDGEGKEEKTSLYFMYMKTKTDFSLAYNNNTTVDEVTAYRMPSNFRRGTGDEFYNSLSFSEEIDEHTIVNNYSGVSSFNINYSALVAQMFDENRRVHKYISYIPLTKLKNINLNDRIKISGRLYIISSIDTNFKTLKTKLELISIEQSDLNPYTEVCNTYVNDSETDSASIVYMTTSGVIEHATIPSDSSLTVCSIGSAFNTTLDASTSGDGDDGDDGDSSTFNASLVATSNIPNTNITYAPASSIYNLNDGENFSITATVNPDNGYQIDSVNPANTYTFSGTIAGSDATASITFTGSSSLIDTSDTTEYTVDLTINNLAGGSTNIDNVPTTTKSFTGTAGTTFTTEVALFLQTNAYWDTYPSASGGTATVQSNTGYQYTNPVYNAEPNNYFKRVVVPLIVTIPNSNVTDTVDMIGSSLAAARVLWVGTDSTVTSGSGTNIFYYLSLEANGESPTVSSSQSWASIVSNVYSNNQGTVTVSYTGNVTQNARATNLVVTASIDSSSDTIVLNQNAASDATSGSLTCNGIEFNALDGVLSWNISLTTNGLWNLESNATGLTFTPSLGSTGSSQSATITWDESTQSSNTATLFLKNTSGTVLDTCTITFIGGGGSGTTTLAPTTTTSTTTTTTTTTTTLPPSYNYWTAVAQNGTVANFQFDNSYVLGDMVNTSVDSQQWEIIASGSQSNPLTNTITGLVTTTTTTTTTTTLPPVYSTTMNKAGTANDACNSGTTVTVYHSSNANPLGSHDIYSSSSLTTLAASGHYNNGSLVSYWSGSSWSGVNSCSSGGGL